MKRTLGIFLSLLIALSVVVFPTTASAVSTVSKTVTQYTDINLTFDKPASDEYNCKVDNNDNGYIKVDANNEGNYYWLVVKAYKATKSVKPLITITDAKNGTEIKKYQITVKAATKIKHANEKMNKGVCKELHIKNPYYLKDHKFSYNKKIIKFQQGGYGYSGNWIYNIKGLKKGTTTLKVKLKGTNFVVSKFKITVGDYKASIKKAYKKTSLKYNKHINKSYYILNGGTLNVGEAVKNFHANGKISVKIKNKKILKSRKAKKTMLTPTAVELYSLKTGKTTVTVYEKRGKAKKKKLGKITVTVKRMTDADVYGNNREYDNDGIFYEFFVKVGDNIDLKTIVTKRYLNTSISKFKDSEYKFTFKATPEDVMTVDENGVFTILKNDNNEAEYTITFADGSKVTGGGSFDIVDDDFY